MYLVNMVAFFCCIILWSKYAIVTWNWRIHYWTEAQLLVWRFVILGTPRYKMLFLFLWLSLFVLLLIYETEHLMFRSKTKSCLLVYLKVINWMIIWLCRVFFFSFFLLVRIDFLICSLAWWYLFNISLLLLFVILWIFVYYHFDMIWFSQSSVLHSQPKSTVGTPAYIAPEVLLKKEYDGKVIFMRKDYMSITLRSFNIWFSRIIMHPTIWWFIKHAPVEVLWKVWKIITEIIYSFYSAVSLEQESHK